MRLLPVVVPTLEPDSDGAFTPEELDDQRSAETAPAVGGVAKHYGPGPHPGTGTDQTVHGSGDSRLRSTVTAERKGRKGKAETMVRTDDDETPKTESDLTFSGEEWPDWLRESATDAVALFEEKFPDQLPPKIEFIYEEFPPEESNTAAYVQRSLIGDGVAKPVVHINTAHIVNNGVYEDGVFYSHEELMKIHKGSLAYISTEVANSRSAVSSVDSLQAYYEATLFHELAHLLPIPDDIKPDIPYYGPEWFPYPTTPAKDNNLPSYYATVSPWEYVAEAFADVAYNGDEAGEYSHRVVEVVTNQ